MRNSHFRLDGGNAAGNAARASWNDFRTGQADTDPLRSLCLLLTVRASTYRLFGLFMCAGEQIASR